MPRQHGHCRPFSRAGDSHLFTGAIFHDGRVPLSGKGRASAVEGMKVR